MPNGESGRSSTGATGGGRRTSNRFSVTASSPQQKLARTNATIGSTPIAQTAASRQVPGIFMADFYLPAHVKPAENAQEIFRRRRSLTRAKLRCAHELFPLPEGEG